MTDKQHGDESGPTPDDEAIAYTAHRELIRQFGKLAATEQQRLERECRLVNGRRPSAGLKRRPRGVFRCRKAWAGLT